MESVFRNTALVPASGSGPCTHLGVVQMGRADRPSRWTVGIAACRGGHSFDYGPTVSVPDLSTVATVAKFSDGEASHKSRPDARHRRVYTSADGVYCDGAKRFPSSIYYRELCANICTQSLWPGLGGPW